MDDTDFKGECRAPTGDFDDDLDVDGCAISETHFTKNIDYSYVNKKGQRFESMWFDSGRGDSLGTTDSVDGSLSYGSYGVTERGSPIAVVSAENCVKRSSPQLFSGTSDYYSNDLNANFTKLKLQENQDEGFCSHGELPSAKSDSCAPQLPIELAQTDKKSCSELERLQAIELETFSQDDDGDTQLHMSIIQGLVDLALYFISLAPDSSWLDIPNNLLQTPLHLAVITNQVSVVRRLMTGGSDVDPTDHRGNTPLHTACIEGYDAIVRNLLDPVRYDETRLNTYEISYQKIPQNLEAKNYDGQTCLHLAAERTFLGIIRILLAKGANINAHDGKSGRTVLHYAAESGNRILLKQLLEYPTLDLNSETYSGATALVLAQGRGYIDIVNILKERGAVYDSSEEESSEEEMAEMMYDDFRINGEPVSFT